jgi:sulfatase maturation enzyme AslB (radical SAM superfamily)
MNDYYCVLPFFSIETAFKDPSKNIFCCRLTPGTDIAKVRESILDKQKSPNCGTCWALEKNGLQSERQIHNNTLDFLLDLNLENIENLSKDNGFDPKVIKIATSNICNGTCVTCNSTWSSAWAALDGTDYKYKHIDLDLLEVDWANIVSLSFVGGEPLLEKKNFAILQTLINNQNTNCFISIVTNGSIELSQHQIDILRQFPNLNICLSIDGVGKTFEYMRFPLKWDLFLSNLSIFKSMTKNISVSCMISNLNIYYYSEMIDFFKQNDLNYLCKQITDPNIFSPSNLSEEAKQKVLANNLRYASEVKTFLYLNNRSLRTQLVQEIQRQDSLKNIDIGCYIPEVKNLL